MKRALPLTMAVCLALGANTAAGGPLRDAIARTATELANDRTTDVLVRLVLEETISTRTANAGQVVWFRTADPVTVGNHVIPAGSPASGTIVRCDRPGRLHGSAELVVGDIAIRTPDGASVGSDDTISRSPFPLPRRSPPSEATVKGRILLGMVAGYGGAWLASRWSHSEEHVAAAGVATGVATVTLAEMLPRGQDVTLGRGTIVVVSFR